MAVHRIGELSSEIQQIILNNHKDMGDYCHRDSAIHHVNEKLRDISKWVEAIKCE